MHELILSNLIALSCIFVNTSFILFLIYKKNEKVKYAILCNGLLFGMVASWKFEIIFYKSFIMSVVFGWLFMVISMVINFYINSLGWKDKKKVREK